MNTLMFGAQKRTESFVRSFINGSHKKVVAFVTLASMIAVMIPVAPVSASINNISVGSQNPLLIAPGSSATFQISINNGSPAGDVKLTVSNFGSGVTGSFSNACLSVPANTTATTTLNVTTTGAVSPGTDSFTVSAQRYSSTNGTCSGANFSPTSDNGNLSIGRTTVTTITSDTPDPSVVGQAYTVNVSVTRSGGSSPINGTVTISDGVNSCQDTSASGGNISTVTYSCSLTSTTDGTKILTASYAGNSSYLPSSVTSSHQVNVPDTTAPVIAEVTPIPALTNDTTPSYTFSSDEAGTLVPSGNAWCSTATPTAVVVGNNTVTFTTPNGSYTNCVIKVKDASNNQSNSLLVPNFVVNSAIFPEGMVSLSFDDGWESIYDNARPILNAAGIKSTQYIYTDGMFGATSGGWTDYMTATEVRQMHLDGHEIGAHTRTHDHLVGTTTTALFREINGSRQDLIQSASAVPVNTFAYPYGEFDSAEQAHLKSAGFVGARGTEDGYNDQSTNRYALRMQEIFNTTTVAEVKSWIDTATSTHSWLILMFHKVQPSCSGPSDSECMTPANLQAIVDYLTVNGVSVKTVKDGLASMPNHPVSDGNAPVITQADISVPATSLAGAVVTYSPVVSDSDTNLPAPLKAWCTTPLGLISGSTFPIGVTTVSCNVVDTGGNNNYSTPKTFTVTVANADLVAPTVTLSTVASNPTSTEPIWVSATWSESVTGFVSSDVVITNGTITHFSGTTTSYQFGIIPNGDGLVTAQVPASSAVDLFNNPNTVSNTFSITYDHVAPVVTLTMGSFPYDSNPVALHTTDSYNELSATASDAVQGIIPVVVTGVVNTALPGSYTVTYTATDAAGNVGTAVRTVNVSDNSAPVFSNVPSSLLVEATSPAGAVVTYTLPTVTDDVPGVSAVVCTPASGATLSIVGSPHTVSCSATDAAGNIGSASFIVTVVDTTAPVLTAPVDQTFEATGVLTTPVLIDAVASDAVDMVPVVTHDVHTFGVGTETVVWSSVDASGNISSTTTSLVTIVDTTAPFVSITPVSTPRNTVPPIVFSATDLVTSSPLTECSVDAGVFTACTSPFDSGIVGNETHSTDGVHTVAVRAVDGAGNSSAPVEVSFTLDTTQPTATIAYDIETPTNTDVVATITPSESITVTNNGGLLSHTFTLNGSFTFEFIDDAGNTGSALASVSTIDKNAPVLTVDSFPQINSESADDIFVFGICSEEGLPVALSMGSLSQNTSCTLNTWSGTFDLTGESDGPVTLFVSQTDAVGNTHTVSSGFSKDTVAPTATIAYDIETPTNTDVVATITPSESITVTNNGGLLSHTFTLNGSFTFEFIDDAGNTGSALASVSTIDKIVPTIEITNQPDSSINVNNATLTYVADDEAVVPSFGAVAITCSVTGGGVVDLCTATSTALSGLADGTHTVTVTATDAVGNTASDSATFVVDFTDPVVTLGTITGLPTAPSILFTVADLSAVTSECRVNDGVFSPCSSPFALLLTNGTYSVTIRATDAVGNLSAEVSTDPFVVDLPPTVTLVGSSPLVYPQNATFVDPGATAVDAVDGIIATSSIIATGSVNTAILGTYTITYTATDTAGNTAFVTRDVIVTDLTLSGEQNAEVSQNSAVINWVTSHPATSRVVYDIVSHSDTDALLAGPNNYGYAFSTTEDTTLVTNHSVGVSGLTPGTTYYFRPVSHGSPELLGAEVSAVTHNSSAQPVVQNSSGGGGGGGGGGGFVVTNYGIKINSGATTTTSANVTLTIIKPGNATQMWVSNIQDVQGTSWMNVKESMPWTLTAGSGLKNVYIRFGSGSTTIATAQTSIMLTDGSVYQPVGQVLGASTGLSCYTFTQTLSVGSSGADVTALQNRLMQEGLYAGPITGYFGQMTKSSVLSYQAKKGLPKVGLVGPQTRAVLNVCEGSVLGVSTTSSGGTEKEALLKQLSELLALVAKLQAELIRTKGN